jgi:nucleotide-binding universal stress UspA family protein
VKGKQIQGLLASSPARSADAKCEADLVVIGTQGRPGLTRLVLGSVADAVVRGADIPGMTGHERQQE